MKAPKTTQTGKGEGEDPIFGALLLNWDELRGVWCRYVVSHRGGECRRDFKNAEIAIGLDSLSSVSENPRHGSPSSNVAVSGCQLVAGCLRCSMPTTQSAGRTFPGGTAALTQGQSLDRRTPVNVASISATSPSSPSISPKNQPSSMTSTQRSLSRSIRCPPPLMSRSTS